MPRFKDRVYLQQDIYNKLVKNKVENKEFKEYISNYIREYVNYSIRDTHYKDYVDNINVDILDNGVVIAKIDDQEFMRINLDKNIINGQRNRENISSRMECMIESTIDVQEAIFEADMNSNAPTYGSSLDEETKAQVLENNINKAYMDNSKEIFNIESGEYINTNIVKKSILQVYSDAIKWDKNMNVNSLNKIIDDFHRQYQRTDEVIEIPAEDFTVEIDGKEEKASYQDIIVSEKPEIIKESNELIKVYNEDGSRKEVDEILFSEEEQINRIDNDGRIKNDKEKEILKNQTKEEYVNAIYDAFLKGNLLDILRRLGYDRVKEELKKLENEEIGELKSDGGETQKNIEYLQNNKDRIMEKLTPENCEKYEELLNKIQQDIQKQNEAIINIDKNEISRLNEKIENLKSQVNEKGESIIEPYNEEELKQADNNRREKREKRKEALKEKANEIKEENSKKKDPKSIDEDTKTTKKEKNGDNENSKENNQEKTNVENLYYDTNLKDDIERLNKKIDEISQDGNVNKDILEELNNLNVKVSNLDIKDNDKEISKIKEEISNLQNKIDFIENKDEMSKDENIEVETPKNGEKINDNESIIDNEEIEQNKKDILPKDDHKKGSSNTEIETEFNDNIKEENNLEDNKEDVEKSAIKEEIKENNLDIEEKKTKDAEDLIDNEKEEQNLNDVVLKDDNEKKISNIDSKVNLEDNVKVESKFESDKENVNINIKENDDKEENIQRKDNKLEKEHEYKDVEARVESFKEYAKELSKKIMDKKLSEILSNEKLNTHQKAVEVGNLNNKKQEYYEYILDLVKKVTIRENSLAEYKGKVDEKNKKIVELEEALKDIKSIEEHLKQVEQEINEEERSNNLGK